MNQPAHEQRNLGRTEIRRFQSAVNDGQAIVLPNYRTVYPPVVVEALGRLYQEYNLAFADLVRANREWSTDYRFALYGPGGTPVNFAVQIDMLGLTSDDLQTMATLSVAEVVAILRRQIFEIENSLAMYQLLERCCAPARGDSFFRPRWRQTLQDLRGRHRMPVALLAVTDQKYRAMLESEFGKQAGEGITDAEVMALSGFDRFFSPGEFAEYIRTNGGRCGYLLYVRASDPVNKLKNPGLAVEHPLLGNSRLRQAIKEYSVTFNIDGPEKALEDRINDTKKYLLLMQMGFPIRSVDDFFSSAARKQLAEGRGLDEVVGEKLSPDFVAYLHQCGVDPGLVASGQVHLRAKPIQEAYGCYGHHFGPLNSRKDFRAELAASLRKRPAGYVVQPEMLTPRVTNTSDGRILTYIDRNFLGINAQGKPVFLGGFRSLLPADSREAKAGRIHGNKETIWAEITT